MTAVLPPGDGAPTAPTAGPSPDSASPSAAASPVSPSPASTSPSPASTSSSAGRTAFTLRTATPDDLDAIMAIERVEFPEDAWSAATMAAELANPIGRYLVAVEGGDVVGYAGVRAAGDQADVQTIAVRADRRRVGIGRALLLELLAEGRRRGAGTAFLEVRADNIPAQTLYTRLGFLAFLVRPAYYPGGIDAIVMQKELTR